MGCQRKEIIGDYMSPRWMYWWTESISCQAVWRNQWTYCKVSMLWVITSLMKINFCCVKLRRMIIHIISLYYDILYILLYYFNINYLILCWIKFLICLYGYWTYWLFPVCFLSYIIQLNLWLERILLFDDVISRS